MSVEANRGGSDAGQADAPGRVKKSSEAAARGQSSMLLLELILEVHSAITRALKNPESFTRVRRNPTVRRVSHPTVSISHFFIVGPDALVVFAVLHAARHDRVWKRRAKREK